MIAGVSKAATLYLAPLLSFTALLLALFAFLAPTVMLHDRVALLSVFPSTSLTQPGSSDSIDGPTVLMGALGSCSRNRNADALNCTAPTLSPVFDLSALPKGAPDLLSAPTATTPGFIAVALGLSFIFFLMFSLASIHHKLPGKLGAQFEKPIVGRVIAWVGLLGFMIGLTAFLVIRMWFGKAVEDFNLRVQELGNSGPQLAAFIGNGFTMIWVAYAFMAVPLVCALAKLHASTTSGKGA